MQHKALQPGGTERNSVSMTKAITRLACAGVFAVVAFGQCAFAQNQNGTLRGIVLDPQGKPIADVKLAVMNEATGISMNSESSSAGIYAFPSLLVGTYTLKTETANFVPYTRTGIQVSAAQITD